MKAKLKNIQGLHTAICLAILIAYGMLGNITSFESLTSLRLDPTSVISLVGLLLSIRFSQYLYKRQLKNINAQQRLEEKILLYQTASIIRWAIIEAAAFLILFLDPNFILFGVFILLYLLWIRPTEDQFRKDVETRRQKNYTNKPKK